MDPFKNFTPGLESPATRLAEITPNDTTDLPFLTRAITAETAGYVQVITADGDSGRIFIAAGVPFPIRISRVLATGTTVSGIVGLA